MKLATILVVLGMISSPMSVHASPPALNPPAMRIIVRCGSFMKPGTVLPPGAKLYGRLPANGAALYRAAVTNDAPLAADPIKGLNEVEPDDNTKTTSVTMFEPNDPHPLSVACSYGTKKTPPFAQAILFIPISDRARGQCRFQDGHASRTMICTGR